MIAIEKTSNGIDFNIALTSGNVVMEISRMGSDICMKCRYKNYSPVSTISFAVQDDETVLYPIFERLYDNIVTGNVINGDMDDLRVRQLAGTQKEYSWFKDIVNDNGINITSDDFSSENADTLHIRKEAGKIVLEFTRVTDGNYPKMPFFTQINIRQEQSRSHDFAWPFRNTLFRELQNVQPVKYDGKILSNAPIKPNGQN